MIGSISFEKRLPVGGRFFVFMSSYVTFVTVSKMT
jgi:hypothetical protein